MKKLTIVLAVVLTFLLAFTFSGTEVFAEGETTDPVCETGYELVEEECVLIEDAFTQNFIDSLTSWNALKNFIVSIGGVSILAFLYKLRKAYKFLKSPDGSETIYKHVEKFLGRITDKPQLLISLVSVVSQLPVIQGLINSFNRQVKATEASLRAEILKLSNQINLDVYAEGIERDNAVALLEDLKREYENNTTSG